MCVCVCLDENVPPYEALLPTQTPSAPPISRHHPGRRWNGYLRVCRDGVKLSVHTQRLARLHGRLHRLLAARQETDAERYLL